MEITLTFETDAIDLDVVFTFLHNEAYWAKGRSREIFDRSIAGSTLVVGAIDGKGRTVGFARVVSDRATFAWLCDVFVLDAARGTGLGKRIVDAAVGHPRVAGVRRYLLATTDAHGLYARFGFEPLDGPERWMMRSGSDS